MAEILMFLKLLVHGKRNCNLFAVDVSNTVLPPCDSLMSFERLTWLFGREKLVLALLILAAHEACSGISASRHQLVSNLNLSLMLNISKYSEQF